MRLQAGTPILWRGDGRHQVGIGSPVRIGAGTAAALIREGGAVPPDRPALRARLAAAGHVEGESCPPAHVRVRGLSTAGVVAAEALVRAGARLSLVDARTDDARSAEPGVLPALARGTRAARAARLVHDLLPGSRVDLDESRTVDVEVVVAVATIPAPVVHLLMVTDTPHVAILTDESRATVLPVRPGMTACVRCLDLWRTREDPAWPVLAAQCETLAPALPALTASIAGGLAASAAVALARGGPAPSAWHVVDGMVRPAEIAADPACGCGAAA